MKVYIKEWFLKKMQSEQQSGIKLISAAAEVMGETEKAYKLAVDFVTLDGEFDGVKLLWCPKSCTVTEEEYEAEVKASAERFENGCKAYAALLKFAKDNGVKGVREGMRKTTILAKIQAAGLEYVA